MKRLVSEIKFVSKFIVVLLSLSSLVGNQVPFGFAGDYFLLYVKINKF